MSLWPSLTPGFFSCLEVGQAQGTQACRCSPTICLPNICFSICMWIAFLPFEVPNHHPPHLLFCLQLKVMFNGKVWAATVAATAAPAAGDQETCVRACVSSSTFPTHRVQIVHLGLLHCVCGQVPLQWGCDCVHLVTVVAPGGFISTGWSCVRLSHSLGVRICTACPWCGFGYAAGGESAGRRIAHWNYNCRA